LIHGRNGNNEIVNCDLNSIREIVKIIVLANKLAVVDLCGGAASHSQSRRRIAEAETAWDGIAGEIVGDRVPCVSVSAGA